jgi:beta-lactamase class A
VPEVEEIFESVGCDGALCALAEDGRAVEVDPDQSYVAASLIKVLIAVEVVRGFDAGDLDPTARIGLPIDPRTVGPVGFSHYRDPVELSTRDLLVAMLTLSDNVATDALLQQVTVAGCNATAAVLGLNDTYVDCNIRSAIDQIGVAAGFTDFAELVAWSAGDRTPEEHVRIDELAMAARSLDPGTATRTTARDMCRLLQAIWSDQAASPEGCARIRTLMAQQLTRHRIASGFERGAVKVAAKSGGLIGVYRHEAGAVEVSRGERYFVAVLTKTRPGHAGDQAINAAIGRVAATAVDELRPTS